MTFGVSSLRHPPSFSVVDRSEYVRPAASHFFVILNGVKDPAPCVRSQPTGRNGFFAAAQNDRITAVDDSVFRLG